MKHDETHYACDVALKEGNGCCGCNEHQCDDAGAEGFLTLKTMKNIRVYPSQTTDAEGNYEKGMTLLDYFAGLALQGLIAQGGIQGHLDGGGENNDQRINAQWAYKFAQAMLEERSKHL